MLLLLFGSGSGGVINNVGADVVVSNTFNCMDRIPLSDRYIRKKILKLSEFVSKQKMHRFD